MDDSDDVDGHGGRAKKPRYDESAASGSGNLVCPFKHSTVKSRVEEPGCDIDTNGRTFQVLDEVGSDSEDNGEGDSQGDDFGKFVIRRICSSEFEIWLNELWAT